MRNVYPEFGMKSIKDTISCLRLMEVYPNLVVRVV